MLGGATAGGGGDLHSVGTPTSEKHRDGYVGGRNPSPAIATATTTRRTRPGCTQLHHYDPSGALVEIAPGFIDRIATLSTHLDKLQAKCDKDSNAKKRLR